MVRPSPRLFSPWRHFRIQPYIDTLRTSYPNADAPSLIGSFLFLHEVTAVLPVLVIFFGFKSAGVGEGLVGWATETGEVSAGAGEGGEEWGRRKVRRWVQEGEETAESVGRRYGVLGYEKESREEKLKRREAEAMDDYVAEGGATRGVKIGGDVANLVGAYIVVKVS